MNTNEFIEIGTFEIVSDKIRVSDPCYDKETESKNFLLNPMKGKWTAYVSLDHSRVVRSLNVISDNKNNRVFLGNEENWIPALFSVGVDSGQAGVFDYDSYPDGDVGEYDDNNSFYNRVCNITINEPYSGCLSFGAVSSSGYGDGVYKCEYQTDSVTDEIIAIRIIFIQDNSDDDSYEYNSDDDYYPYYNDDYI